ncbi:patatin-like phospholipase family protein [Paenarthrobacter nitroguajacolicus]|uniref:patatin-like phospholipase family protein n=1 Tax=Paenarthrobacter nitroguajacolicus TaxID=211146 RepID=UPI0015BC2A73|nr:patatin-like phospholipase family protein [Paenarthrobacter nitroguajacolicus]NWL32086.1 patatin [Paenarthrobacter nitroguajacolicus]
MNSHLRILSVDGGGIRGYLPALILAEIERRASRPAVDLFDLVVGTSTGGIIAIGLAAGVPVQDLAEFYPRYGRRIFGGSEQPEWSKRLFGTGATWSERLMGPANTIGAPFGRDDRWGGNARHQAAGLEGVLEEVLGDTMLSQARLPLLVTSYEAQMGLPVVFSSAEANHDPARFDLPLRSVARATSAAPTFFAPAMMTWAGGPRQFVDGGVWANNPAALAITESIRITASQRRTGTSVFLVSLGTGMAASTPAFAGEGSWLAAFSDLAKIATSITGSDILATRALGDSYARLQVIDDRIAGAMDDPSLSRLEALQQAAQSLIQSESGEIDRIVANIKI